MNLTSIEALMTTNYMTWYQSASSRNEHMSSDALLPEKLIERFDVNMYLEICNIDVCAAPALPIIAL